MPLNQTGLGNSYENEQEALDFFEEHQDTDIFFHRMDESLNEAIQLPVLPEKLTYTREGNVKEVMLLNAGSVYIPRKPKNMVIEFESFFPSTKNSVLPMVRTKDDFHPSGEYTDYFRRAMYDLQPLWFIVTGSLKTKVPVVIQNYEQWSEGGSPSDKFYKLTLVRYSPEDTKDQKIKKAKANKKKNFKVGDLVEFSGKAYAKAGDKKPKQKSYKKVTAKINYIKKEKANPYHLVNSSNNPIGWVKKGTIKGK